MKLLRRPITIFLVLFVVIAMLGLALFSFVGVSNQSTSLSIRYGNYSDAIVYLPVGGMISYDLKVTSGDPVNVYLMPDAQVSNFVNQLPFDPIKSASFNDTTQAHGSVWVGAGWYHLIVVTQNLASSSITLGMQGGPTIGQLLIIPIFSLIISAVVVLLIRRRRKKMAKIEAGHTVNQAPVGVAPSEELGKHDPSDLVPKTE